MGEKKNIEKTLSTCKPLSGFLEVSKEGDHEVSPYWKLRPVRM